MKAPWWWLLVTALTTVAHCLVPIDQGAFDVINSSPQDDPPRPALPCHKISVSNIDFAFSLYRKLALCAPEENILFSPASISLALATLSWEAPMPSRARLLEDLGFNLSMVPEAEIQAGFRDLLLRLPEQNPQLLLNAGQHRFSDPGQGSTWDQGEAQKRVSKHIEKQTQGRLGAWAENLGNETAALLVSHAFFRAKWAQPFDPRTTSLREFFVDEHRAVQVPMVKQTARHRFLHDPDLQCTVLQMDHSANATIFFVFPKRGSLRQLEDALLPETLIKWDRLLGTRELSFYLPKFSIASTFSLEMLLPPVTMVRGSLRQPTLNISKVTHRATMTLDEEGSEAAAVTSIQLTPGPRPALDASVPPGPEFSQPFLVLTFHTETGSMLFLGKAVNPLR